MTAAWMNGLLSQADPRNYPKLDQVLGTEAPAPARPAPAEANIDEAVANARAWGAVLQALNRKAAKQQKHDPPA